MVVVADRASALLLVVSQIVIACVLVYAAGQGDADGDGKGAVAVFHPAYLVLSAGVSLAFLAGDLFDLYVGIEILLTASYVLLTLGGTLERVRAGMTYVVVSLASSIVLLTSIGLIYGATGTVTMADLGPRLDALPDGTRTALQLALLTAFGSRRRSSRWPRGCRTATRPHRRRSPRCSRGCSPRSGCTRSCGPRRCCSAPTRPGPCCWWSRWPRWSSASSARWPRTTCAGCSRSPSSATSGS